MQSRREDVCLTYLGCIDWIKHPNFRATLNLAAQLYTALDSSCASIFLFQGTVSLISKQFHDPQQLHHPR